VTEAATLTVPGMYCEHCKAAAVPGVPSVEIDLDAKLVVVHGEQLDDTRLRLAIDEAGYDAASWRSPPRHRSGSGSSWKV
jgi:copper chaperone